jgi:hypothetical protein
MDQCPLCNHDVPEGLGNIFVVSNAKPARPDLYPSHTGVGSCSSCTSLRADLARKTAEATAFFEDGVKVRGEAKRLREVIERNGEMLRLKDIDNASLRARIDDVEGMAKVIFESETDKTIEWSDNLGDWLRKNYLRHARAVQKFLKGEG